MALALSVDMFFMSEALNCLLCAVGFGVVVFVVRTLQASKASKRQVQRSFEP
jgi:hypothetical protein